jgi:RNA polymerase sigma factor (sigma-70 family)
MHPLREYSTISLNTHLLSKASCSTPEGVILNLFNTTKHELNMKAADFTQKIISLRPMLKTFTHRFTRDREESLDLIQDTMLKALIYKDKFKNDTNLKGWLFTIMRNTFINNYRKAQRFRVNHDDSKEQYYLNVKDTHTFNLPDSSHEYNDIWRLVDNVKDELQVPFKMHASGYKYNEIAEHLKIPIGTVKNRIFQARKEIQHKLIGY